MDQSLWGEVSSLSTLINDLETRYPSLKTTLGDNQTGEHLREIDIPDVPEYFKLGKLISVDDDEQKEIRIEVEAESLPTVQCGDGCAVNSLAAEITENAYGIPSPFARCHAHIAHGKFKLFILRINYVNNTLRRAMLFTLIAMANWVFQIYMCPFV